MNSCESNASKNKHIASGSVMRLSHSVDENCREFLSPSKTVASILLVSNYINDHSFISSALSEIGQVTMAASAYEAMEMCQVNTPDIILVEDTQIEKGGARFSQFLDSFADDYVMPIFVLSHCSHSLCDKSDCILKEFLMTFDCLPRPLQKHEVSSRVERVLKIKMLVQATLQEAQNASAVAYEAMKASSETGVLIRSMDKIHQSSFF